MENATVNSQNIAVIGAGNMGSSLIGGLIADHYDPKLIWASNPNQEKLDDLQRSLRIHVTTDNKEAAKQADAIIFAVKPSHLVSVLRELEPVICTRQPLVMSIVTGVRVNSLMRILGDNLPIVRCMPNTPCLVKAGVTGLYAGKTTSDLHKETAESIMRSLGITLWVKDEDTLDILTALSGSGPAYFFRIMEALQKAGESLGLALADARLLTLQTAMGAARLALECEQSLDVLRQNVASPKGTTEAGLAVFEKVDIDAIFFQVLKAAKERSKVLADSFDLGVK